jgi:hypothetical protein
VGVVVAWEEEKLEAREMLENSYNGLRYLRVGGRGQCLGAGKTRSQKNAPKSRRLPHVRCTLCWATCLPKRRLKKDTAANTTRFYTQCLDRLDNRFDFYQNQKKL